MDSKLPLDLSYILPDGCFATLSKTEKLYIFFSMRLLYNIRLGRTLGLQVINNQPTFVSFVGHK